MNKYSLLIIDDNEVDRYLLKRLLGQTSLDVTIFEEQNGAGALAFLRNYEENRLLYPDDFPPMILFLDINMPIVNGWDFLAEFSDLRKQLDINSSVVIMFTTSDNPDDRKKADSHDFVTDYLIKGEFTPELLESTLRSLAA